MVELDGELVGICREHLPEWSDCGDSGGSDATSCFDDSRASLEFVDAFEWFTESFGDVEQREVEVAKFDVIVMDALDPDQFVAIVGSLYKDDAFIDSLYNGLSDGGVVSTLERRNATPAHRVFISDLASELSLHPRHSLWSNLDSPIRSMSPRRMRARAGTGRTW
jgi:spermidine synthase